MSIYVDDEPRTVAGTKLAVGIFLVLLGVVLAADNLGLIDGDEYLRFWPSLLIVIGALNLGQQGGSFLATLLIVVGASILAYNLHLLPFTIFDLWPLILVAIGVALVLRAFGKAVPPLPLGELRPNALAILSSRQVSPNTRTYTGGRVAAFLGACEVDLTRADIEHNPAVLETVAIWGGIVVTVPRGWEVVGNVMPVMGGFESKLAPATDPRRQLIVRGLALMGGIEVKNPEERSAA